MPSFSTEIKLNGLLCLHARDQFRGTLADRKANSYLCPLGMEPGKVWLIMKYGDIDSIKDSTEFTLSWRAVASGDGNRLAENFQVNKLYLKNVQRLFPGGEGNPNAAMLVELEDRRALLHRWSDSQKLFINWRSYASSVLYLPETTNEGTPYTWAEAVELLWTLMPSLGPFPGLPYEPTGVPMNFAFHGENAWKAMHTLLHRIDCETAFDPFAETFSIVRLGVVQQPPGNLPNPPYYRAEADHFDNPALDVPEKIRVYFSTHYEAYGQERDTEPLRNWITTQGQYVEVATGVQGAISGTVGVIHDDLLENYDETDTINNQSDMQARAEERVANYVRTNSVKSDRVVYPSLQRYLPGSEVKAVWWKNFGLDQPCGGTVTEVVKYPGMVKTVAEMCDDCEVTRHGPSMPPDLGRHTFPNYPRLPNIVRTCESLTGSDNARANDDGLIAGRVARWVGGEMKQLEECWILFVDDYDQEMGDVTVKGGDYFYARLSGKETSGGVTKPIYLARAKGGADGFWFKATLNCQLCNTGGAAFVKDVEAIGCPDPKIDPCRIRKVSNEYGYLGEAGDKVLLYYECTDACNEDKSGEIDWQCVKLAEITHKPLDMMIGLRVSGVCFVGEFAKVSVPHDGRTWEKILVTGTSCSTSSGDSCNPIDSLSSCSVCSSGSISCGSTSGDSIGSCSSNSSEDP